MQAGLIGTEAAIIIFVLTTMLTRLLLPLLRRRHAGQFILEIGPSWHKSKEGTPTMGGIAPFFAAVLVGGIFIFYVVQKEDGRVILPYLLTLLFALSNACIGFFDDMTKLLNKRNAGLTPLQKLILQSAFAAAYTILLVRYDIITTTLPIPFTSLSLSLGFFWYPLAILFLVWFVNCANLTDGIDGLASSVGGLIGLGFLLIAIRITSISLSLAGATLLGGAIGFLMYNRHPAKIFMGDTGSLFFGALAVGCAFISGSPLIMLPFGIVYLTEGISVVLQVAWFKITRGKRLFRMAPLHHHLEKCGWSETRIVLLFSLLTTLFIILFSRGVSL